MAKFEPAPHVEYAAAEKGMRIMLEHLLFKTKGKKIVLTRKEFDKNIKKMQKGEVQSLHIVQTETELIVELSPTTEKMVSDVLYRRVEE